MLTAMTLATSAEVTTSVNESMSFSTTEIPAVKTRYQQCKGISKRKTNNWLHFLKIGCGAVSLQQTYAARMTQSKQKALVAVI
jgi:hypothetical protein